VRSIGVRQEFDVKPVPTAPPGTDFGAIAAFQRETSELMRRVSGAGEEISLALERLRHMRAALVETPRADPALFTRMDELGAALQGLRTRLNGDQIRQQLNEPSVPSIRNRVGRVAGGHWNVRQTPTATQRRNIQIAHDDFGEFGMELTALLANDLAQLEADLEAAGAPWTPGRRLPR
jgi:hypothetical protein